MNAVIVEDRPTPSGIYIHLTTETAAIVERDVSERLRWLQNQYWVSYRRAEEGLRRLKALLDEPPRNRMPNMLICGPTNNGKTHLIQRFLKDYPQQPNPDGSGDVIPIVRFDCRHGPYTRGLLAELLRALNLGGFATRTSTFMEDMIVDTLIKTRTRMLIIDEIHNIFSPLPHQTRLCLNLLRYFSNVLKIPIVAVGTKEALDVMQRDDQTANRFRPFFLPRWFRPVDEEEYLTLLDSLEALLPLREPSDLSGRMMSRIILRRSHAVIGEMWALLVEGSKQALSAGKERLTPKLLSEIDFEPPSKRRYEQWAKRQEMELALT